MKTLHRSPPPAYCLGSHLSLCCQGDSVQVQADWLPLAGPLPRASGARSRVLPSHQDRHGADGHPGGDGAEPPPGHAAVQQHLQPALLREDRLHRYDTGAKRERRSAAGGAAAPPQVSAVDGSTLNVAAGQFLTDFWSNEYQIYIHSGFSGNDEESARHNTNEAGRSMN